MSPFIIEAGREAAFENLTDNAVEEAAEVACAAGECVVEAESSLSPAAAQAKRESYLRKGQELIHSLL